MDAAPEALISAGLLSQLRDDLSYKLHHDTKVHTYTSLLPKSDPPIRGMKNPRAVSAVTERIAEQVYEQAREGRCVLTLGGDHSIAIGTIAGTARAIRERFAGQEAQDVGVIWVDAHADINTPEASESGNIHGMPVAWLTGLAQKKGNGTQANGNIESQKGGDEEEVFAWLDKTTPSSNGQIDRGGGSDKPMLNLKKLVYIGLRDVDPAEKVILRREGIKAFSMHDIDRQAPFFSPSFPLFYDKFPNE